MTANNSGTADPRYSKRLAIVVPYRDRADHLAKFVPHVAAYFERDKLYRQIAVTINIIEQSGNAPFSRGRLANCGFLLTQETSDYVCIHDVDYLPMWADYSWTQNPARLIWHGRCVREPGDILACSTSRYSPRSTAFPIATGAARRHTFIPLPHKHAGYSAPHVFNDVGRRTNALFAKREPDFEKPIAQDGISTLKFRLVEKKRLALPTTPALPNVFHCIVDLGEPEPGAV